MQASLRTLFDATNEYLGHRRLRRYQADLARTGKFSIADPATGARSDCIGSQYLLPKSFAYDFSSEASRFWLLTGPTARGYPLAIYYDEAADCALYDPNFVDEGYALGVLSQIGAARIDQRATEQPASALMVSGHVNFAHFVWNELPALIELYTEGETPPVEIEAIAEPILPIEEFLPPDSFARITRSSESSITGAYRASLALYATGSEKVTQAVKDLVVQKCLTERAAAPLLHIEKPFTIWLSLRTLYRRPVNEVDVFIDLIKTILDSWPAAMIFLDGYSLPCDVLVQGRYDVSRERGFRDDVADSAKAILKALPPSLKTRIADYTKTDLASSIALAGLADVYICHHGTQQHKIGWLHAKPGVIHAGKMILQTQPAGWVQDQSEGAVLPVYIPPSMVETADSPKNDRQHLEYFSDYRFSDPQAFIDLVMSEVSRVYATWLAVRQD